MTEALRVKEPSATQEIVSGPLPDAEATARFGVGPAGENRRWFLDGDELVLLDNKHGVVYRKKVDASKQPVEQLVEPTAQQVPFIKSKLQWDKEGKGRVDADPGGVAPPDTRAPSEERARVAGDRIGPQARTGRVGAAPQRPTDARSYLDAYTEADMPGPDPSAGPPPDFGIESISTEADRAAKLKRNPFGAYDLEAGTNAPPGAVMGDPGTFRSDPAVIPEATREAVEPDLPPLPEDPPSRPQIQLPSDEKPREPTKLETPEKLPVSKKISLSLPKGAEASPSVDAIVDSTVNTLGFIPTPKNTAIVTIDSLEEQSEPDGEYEITIDPNTNKAWITEVGRTVKIKEFNIGTGDTTGTRYGKQYYSPTGVFKVESRGQHTRENKPISVFGDVEGSMGPLWMFFDAPKSERDKRYALHGPYYAADVRPDGAGFVNKGYVSHGCLRFTSNDIYEVGRYLDIGSTVTILPYEGGRSVLSAE